MYIIFDIGGTKMRVAYSENGDFFDEPKVVGTPKNYEEGRDVFIKLAKECANGREIKKIMGGMSRMIWEGNYERFKKDLEKEFGCAVLVENDAALAGLGEANFGAGRGFPIVAYITVSTGVGGARIVNGKIDEKSIGFEPGKQIIDIENGKSFEDLVSGRGILASTGEDPRDIDDQKFWDHLAEVLAVGLHNIIVEWSPDCVIVGGGMITKNPHIPLEKTEQKIKEILKIFPQMPAIKVAELDDLGGLWGALSFLKN